MNFKRGLSVQTKPYLVLLSQIPTVVVTDILGQVSIFCAK